MKTTCRLVLISLAALAASACARHQEESKTPDATSLTQSHNGLEIQLVASYADGDDLFVTLCYQQPSGFNWVPGRHPDDAAITVAGSSYDSSYLEIIGFRASPESTVTYRCDRIRFVVPSQPPGQVFRLTITNMVGEAPTSSDCPEAKRRLEAEGTGIRIECLEDSGGYALLERPQGMTDLEAAHIVDDLTGEVFAGPWEFDFTVAHLDEQRGTHVAAEQLARLCEKSDRWGLVPWRLRGFSVKWGSSIFWARGKGRGWERDSRFWAFHTARPILSVKLSPRWVCLLATAAGG
jgi:hypothetical protein